MNMKHKGFTLIEMMVAVSIIAIAVTGPLMAASRAYFSAQNAQEQVIASYLSQEAIEFARFRRDSVFLNEYGTNGGNTTNAWSNFLSEVHNTDGCDTHSCTYDTAAGFASCNGGGDGGRCTALSLAGGGAAKLYTQNAYFSGAVATPFTREVRFYKVAPATGSFTNATEVLVTATTTWQSHGQTFTAAVSDTLTPWQ